MRRWLTGIILLSFALTLGTPAAAQTIDEPPLIIDLSGVPASAAPQAQWGFNITVSSRSTATRTVKLKLRVSGPLELLRFATAGGSCKLSAGLSCDLKAKAGRPAQLNVRARFQSGAAEGAPAELQATAQDDQNNVAVSDPARLSVAPPPPATAVPPTDTPATAAPQPTSRPAAPKPAEDTQPSPTATDVPATIEPTAGPSAVPTVDPAVIGAAATPPPAAPSAVPTAIAAAPSAVPTAIAAPLVALTATGEATDPPQRLPTTAALEPVIVIALVLLGLALAFRGASRSWRAGRSIGSGLTAAELDLTIHRVRALQRVTRRSVERMQARSEAIEAEIRSGRS